MRFLGIDPGYALVGWAIVDFDKHRNLNLIDYGVIKTDSGQEISDRLKEIYEDLGSIIEEYNPQFAGIETLLYQKNAKTAMKVSEARGVVNLRINQADIPAYDVTPLQVKSSISGYGKATKSQVQENVKMLCGLDQIPKPDDAADAIAVAICAFDMNYTEVLTHQSGTSGRK